MKNTIKLTRKANTVYAPYLPYAAYNALVQLGKDHNAEIGENADHTLRLTFNEVETAKNVVAKWTANYNANRKVDLAPTKATAPTKKSSTSKPSKKADTKPTASPKKAKGNKKSTLENFVLNNPSCTRNEAVAHGFVGTKSELALLKKSLGVR